MGGEGLIKGTKFSQDNFPTVYKFLKSVSPEKKSKNVCKKFLIQKLRKIGSRLLKTKNTSENMLKTQHANHGKFENPQLNSQKKKHALNAEQQQYLQKILT